jgi:stage IV sporulation protein FB
MGGALNANSAEKILHLGLFLLAGFLSILVHELGHALTARRFGAWSEITLQAFGGYASYSGTRLSRLQSFLVTAAGPVLQIILGLFVWWMVPFLSNANPNIIHFLHVLMVISLVWAVLNLLPVLPLDGGHMLHALLGPRRITITLWITILVSIITAIALYQTTQSYFFALFLGLFAWQAWRALQENRLP